MPDTTSAPRWSSTWPDALAFVVGLGVAWRLGWSTTDLVWSLWLSSLVVGYATIVWTIVHPGLAIGRGIAGTVRSAAPLPVAAPKLLGGAAVFAVGGLLMLAFFTVHFGMFHYVHSQFLSASFPVIGDGGGMGSAGRETYVEVVRRYWLFLPAAFLAERGAFVKSEPEHAAPDAARRRAPHGFAAPYRNVVRMHLLIFFFAAVHHVGVESFAVYAVVYAVYFFPWRVVRRGRGGGGRGAEETEEMARAA